MARLKQIIDENRFKKRKLNEADDEAPAEEELSLDDDSSKDAAPTDAAPVEGADDANADAGDSEEEDDTETEDEEEATPEVAKDETVPDVAENFDDLDKTIEEMVGITEIQHTSSSSILDFEDGGQIMYVQPMVSLQSETLTKIIELIITDVSKTYSSQKDEITGKPLGKTKYWKSISTLVSTMVRSQLTKSDNIDGLIDEIKQIFKVLEVK
jgi:hypothetical protein